MYSIKLALHCQTNLQFIFDFQGVLSTGRARRLWMQLDTTTNQSNDICDIALRHASWTVLGLVRLFSTWCLAHKLFKLQLNSTLKCVLKNRQYCDSHIWSAWQFDLSFICSVDFFLLDFIDNSQTQTSDHPWICRLSVIVLNPPHIRLMVAIGLCSSWLVGNVSEWEGGQTHMPEQIKYELDRFVWFPG